MFKEILYVPSEELLVHSYFLLKLHNLHQKIITFLMYLHLLLEFFCHNFYQPHTHRGFFCLGAYSCGLQYRPCVPHIHLQDKNLPLFPKTHSLSPCPKDLFHFLKVFSDLVDSMILRFIHLCDVPMTFKNKSENWTYSKRCTLSDLEILCHKQHIVIDATLLILLTLSYSKRFFLLEQYVNYFQKYLKKST